MQKGLGLMRFTEMNMGDVRRVFDSYCDSLRIEHVQVNLRCVREFHPVTTIAHAHHDGRVICLNTNFFGRSMRATIATIVHEIGHMVVGPSHSHDEVWRDWTFQWGSSYAMFNAVSDFSWREHCGHKARGKVACRMMFYPKIGRAHV